MSVACVMRTGMEQFKVRTAGDSVRFVGKVIKFDEKEAVVENEHVQVKVVRPNIKNYTNTTFVEVFGKIMTPDNDTFVVEEDKSVAFGTKFNMALYNKMVKFATSAKLAEVFGASAAPMEEVPAATATAEAEEASAPMEE